MSLGACLRSWLGSFLLLLAFVSPAAPGAAQVVGVALDVVAATGDASPDGDGTLGQLGLPSINRFGAVSFRATLLGSFSPDGIFVADNTGLSVVARWGDASPDGNGTYAGFAPGPVPIDRHGHVAYQSSLANTTGGFSDNAGVFIRGAPNRQVVRRGQASPDGNGVFDGFQSVGIEDRDEVTFWASFTGTSGGAFVDDRGVYRGPGVVGETVGPLDELIRMGKPEFAGSLSPIGNIDMQLASHEAGWVAIRAFLDDPTEPLGLLAVFVDDGVDRRRRFTTGDASPDANGTLFSFPIPFVASDGAVASHVTFAGSTLGNAENMGLVFYPASGSPAVMAREGDAAPVDGTFAVDFLDAVGFASTPIAPGRIVFHGLLSGSSGGAGVDDTGLFLARPTGVQELVRRGDPTPELDGEFDSFDWNRAHVNPDRCVVFYADVRNATTLGAGVFLRYSQPDQIVTLARVGQSLLGSTVTSIEILDDSQARLGGVSPINGFCDAAFRVRLADGRDAILATVPEPVGGLAWLVSLLTIRSLARGRGAREGPDAWRERASRQPPLVVSHAPATQAA